MITLEIISKIHYNLGIKFERIAKECGLSYYSKVTWKKGNFLAIQEEKQRILKRL